MEEPSRPSPELAVPVLPTLAMSQLVAIAGVNPKKAAAGSGTSYLGMIQAFAGISAFGALPAQGQMLAPFKHKHLFSLFGTFYGGDGEWSFGLPDLRGRTAVGGPPGREGTQTLAMTYIIFALEPATDIWPPIGSVSLFGGDFTPEGWIACDGSLVRAEDYPRLAAVIGTTFGGSDDAFAVPNLVGRAVYGVGKGPAVDAVALGQIIGGVVPGLGLNYIIRTEGVYPLRDGIGALPTEPFLAQVTAYAGADVPAGWTICDGTTLEIASHTSLFSLLGPTYGGNDITTFALPDLGARVIVGT